MNTPPPRPRFGVSQFTTTPWSFEEDVEGYARLGVNAIEVCEDKLDEGRIPDQMAFIAEHGLEVSSVQPSVRTLLPSRTQPEPKDVRERVDRFRRTIDRLSPFVPGVPFVCNTGPPPDGNVQAVLEVAAQEYRELADSATERGVRVALEPLNPVLMNVESAIWTLEQAMRVVEAVDRDSFGICLDFWNIWQDPEAAVWIRSCGDRTFVVHVSDWRTPRSFEDRDVPGRGEIPLSDLLRATYESGYRGAYTLEIFSAGVTNSLWESDLVEVINESRAELGRLWSQAFEKS